MINRLNFCVAGNRIGAKHGEVLSLRELIGNNTFAIFCKKYSLWKFAKIIAGGYCSIIFADTRMNIFYLHFTNAFFTKFKGKFWLNLGKMLINTMK